VLGDAEREFEIAPLAVRRRAFGHRLQHDVIDDGVVTLCTSRPPATVFCRQASRAWIGQAACEQEAQIPPASR